MLFENASRSRLESKSRASTRPLQEYVPHDVAPYFGDSAVPFRTSLLGGRGVFFAPLCFLFLQYLYLIQILHWLVSGVDLLRRNLKIPVDLMRKRLVV